MILLENIIGYAEIGPFTDMQYFLKFQILTSLLEKLSGITLGSEQWYAETCMGQESSLGDDNLFFRPKHNFFAFIMILFGLFDLILILYVKFVVWIVKQKIENKCN